MDIINYFFNKNPSEITTNNIYGNIILSAILLFAVMLLYSGIKWIVFKEIKNIVSRQYYRKFFLYTSILTTLTILLLIWFEPIRNAIIIFSAFGVGLILGFKELIMCFSGRILLAVNQSFAIGNRIEIGNTTGDVIDIGIMNTTLAEIGGIISPHQSSGRIISFPNALLLTIPVKNYTRKCDYIWDELDFKLDINDDWQETKKLLYDFCQEITGHTQEDAQKEMSLLEEEFAYKMPQLAPFIYNDLCDGKIVLSLRYPVKIRDKRQVRHDIIEKMLITCKTKNIKLY